MSELNKKLEALEDEALEGVAGGISADLQVMCDVMDGKYGNGDERVSRLKAAGYDPVAIQSLVNTYDAAARAVIRGNYGNGAVRVTALRNKGLNPEVVQRIVNDKLR